MLDFLYKYIFGAWSPQFLSANIYVFVNVLGALALGLMVGYERSYRGRAAGMRTYGLVCMSSCALVVIAGCPEFWYGGQAGDNLKLIDPSRVMQGITTGIGFLGAGVIMRDGLNISGLTTAASIWTVATIGVLVGVGFYGAAIMLAIVSTIFMMWGFKIEHVLPSRHAVAITLVFDRDINLTEEDVTRLILSEGYEVANGSFSIDQKDEQFEWRFVAVALGKRTSTSLVKLSECLRNAAGIQDFHVAYARN